MLFSIITASNARTHAPPPPPPHTHTLGDYSDEVVRLVLRVVVVVAAVIVSTVINVLVPSSVGDRVRVLNIALSRLVTNCLADCSVAGLPTPHARTHTFTHGMHANTHPDTFTRTHTTHARM